MFLLDLRARRSPARTRKRARPRAYHREQERDSERSREPFVTSGVRIGSPAMTTRGFKDAEAKKLREPDRDVLDAPERRSEHCEGRAGVVEMCASSLSMGSNESRWKGK